MEGFVSAATFLRIFPPHFLVAVALGAIINNVAVVVVFVVCAVVFVVAVVLVFVGTAVLCGARSYAKFSRVLRV